MNRILRTARTQLVSGFTLIELLVVIAIISILSAVVFPVFAQARGKARQTACLSNEKQVGLAMLQYLQDSDETYPRAWYGNGNGPSDPSDRHKWMDVLRAYVKNDQVFTCPGDDENAAYRFRDARNYGSYSMNAAYWWGGDTYTAPYEQPLSSLARPADTVWVLETTAAAGMLNNFEVEWAWTGDQPAITPAGAGKERRLRNVAERHQGMTNVLWCDGHAKAVRLEELAQKNAGGAYHRFTVEED